MHPDVRAIAQSLKNMRCMNWNMWTWHDEVLSPSRASAVHPGRTAVASLRRLLPERKVPVCICRLCRKCTCTGSARCPLALNQRGLDNQVLAVLEASFSAFRQSEEHEKQLGKGVPLAAPFGNWIGTKQMDVQLRQRINGVVSENPLMSSGRAADGRKWVVTSAKGLWRWRFQEYRTFEQTDAFDDWVGSWLRY